MKRALSITALCFLLLGGCGKQPAQQGNATASAQDYQTQLTAMHDAERNLVFLFQEHKRDGSDSNFFRLDSPKRSDG